jgi:Tfp pilus assembly protein PilF
MRAFLSVTPSLALMLVLSACGSVSTPAGPSATSLAGDQASGTAMASQRRKVLEALGRGNVEKTTTLAADLVSMDPQSSSAHLLLAAGYHLAGDPASLELAGSGYNAARQFAGSDPWPNYLAGAAAFQRRSPRQAMEFFAQGVMADPDNPFTLEGLAAAAYASGNLALSQAAAARARELMPDSGPGWRIATLTAAAGGDTDQVTALLRDSPPSLPKSQHDWVRHRSRTLLRTVQLDGPLMQAQAAAPSSEDLLQEGSTEAPVAESTAAGTPPAAVESAPGVGNQLTVDVTVILADERETRTQGVNLLDGLQGVFGFGKSTTSVDTTGIGVSATKTITRAIRIPDITYNLNIFNRRNRFYEAVARPSLTAYVGEQSSFFVGDQLNVTISGVQVVQLEKVDVGVTLRITPAEVRADGSRFRVEVDRAFFSDQNVGSFREAVSTFRQSVAATADVKFGETLILSGLTESVIDGQSSRTPFLGDIPGVELLFKNRSQLNRKRSAIILVTPSLPVTLARTVDRNTAVDQIVQLWDTLIEPRMGAKPLTERMKAMRLFTRAAADDVSVRDLRDPVLRTAFLQAQKGAGTVTSP